MGPLNAEARKGRRKNYRKPLTVPAPNDPQQNWLQPLCSRALGGMDLDVRFGSLAEITAR
jgi:hypothetical protein